MKKFIYNTFTVAFSMLLAFLSFAPNADACVDPNTLITTTVNFSDDFTEIEVRLGNLKFETEQPNVFCSCALASYDGVFTNPNYIAFVLAGTNTPYGNFDEWGNTSEADDAWSTEYPGYPDWTGYIAEVINAGLSTDDEVELVIRASTPPGTYAVQSDLDSSMFLTTLGTDMWLPDEMTMAFDHTGIRNLRNDVSSFTMNEMSMDYFEQLDNGILSADIEINSPTFNLDIFPNPVAEQLSVSFNLPKTATVNLSIRDISGKLIANLYQEKLPEGEQRIPLEVAAILSENNLYLLEIEVDGIKGVRKFVK